MAQVVPRPTDPFRQHFLPHETTRFTGPGGPMPAVLTPIFKASGPRTYAFINVRATRYGSAVQEQSTDEVIQHKTTDLRTHPLAVYLVWAAHPARATCNAFEPVLASIWLRFGSRLGNEPGFGFDPIPALGSVTPCLAQR